MKKPSAAVWEHVKLVATIAEMKQDNYRTTLTLSAMLELLIDKGILTRDELEHKAALLDQEMEQAISASLHPMG